MRAPMQRTRAPGRRHKDRVWIRHRIQSAADRRQGREKPHSLQHPSGSGTHRVMRHAGDVKMPRGVCPGTRSGALRAMHRAAGVKMPRGIHPVTWSGMFRRIHPAADSGVSRGIHPGADRQMPRRRSPAAGVKAQRGISGAAGRGAYQAPAVIPRLLRESTEQELLPEARPMQSGPEQGLPGRAHHFSAPCSAAQRFS